MNKQRNPRSPEDPLQAVGSESYVSSGAEVPEPDIPELVEALEGEDRPADEGNAAALQALPFPKT